MKAENLHPKPYAPNTASDAQNHVWAIVWTACLNCGLPTDTAKKIADESAAAFKY